MPIQIKDPATVAAKWAKRASAAGADYTSGVNNPRTDQASAAAAAAPVWAQAVADAASRNAFAKGVTAAGSAKWQAAAASIGAQRYPQGVNAAQGNYANKEAPYLTALSNLSLPPRGVKGTNNARVQAVVDALRKVKLGQ
jgi:hypothetical protein